MPLRKPALLMPGGHLAVLAISSPSKADRIEAAKRHLEQAGLRVTLAGNVYGTERSYLAGDDEQRLTNLNQCLNSEQFDAFLFTRGGYGAMRILDRIDYRAIARNPRPIVGFSDLTALHQAVAVRANVSTFHGPMLNSDFYERLSPDHERWFFSMLSGQAPLVHEFSPAQVVSAGAAEGTIFGGCLSLTAALIGTPYDFWIEDGIWFWEDVDEPTYRIDRMLTHLRLGGRLKNLRGVMIGRLKGCGGEDARELDLLLSEFFTHSGIPVVRDLPFGHHGNSLMIPIGSRVRLDTVARTVEFPDSAVEVPSTRIRALP